MDKEISYGEIFENIEAVAKSLSAMGVKQGDIVTLCLPNIPEAVYLFFALNKLGAICHMFDPRASAAVMLEHLSLAPSKLVFVFPDILPVFETIREQAGIRDIILIAVTEAIGIPAHYSGTQNIKYYSEFLAAGLLAKVTLPIGEADERPICILHTGGTTGIPKGATLTNKNFHSLWIQWSSIGLPYRRGKSLLSLMPPFVSFGLAANLYVPLCAGMKLILIPDYDPGKIVEQIKKYRPNCIPASPAHWEYIYQSKEMEAMDLSFLEFAFIGGDTLNETIESSLNKLFKKTGAKTEMHKGYGMTEASTAIALTIPGKTNLLGSVGVPLPQIEIGIFNDDLEECPFNMPGEIAVRGDTVMRGFYRNELETQRSLVKHADGKIWLHTGDIGEMQEDGVMFIKGRKKRIIIRFDGIKVYPADVEAKLLEHPLIHSCAVVSGKDSEHIQGMVPVAFVVLENGCDYGKAIEDISKFGEEQIVYYAVPNRYLVLEELPYTPNGKIDFLKLEEIVKQK